MLSGLYQIAYASTDLEAGMGRLGAIHGIELSGETSSRNQSTYEADVGDSDAQILRALGEDNAKLAKRDRVTIDSIRNHTGRHFQSSRWRGPRTGRSLSDRAKENGVDFVEGVATALRRWPSSRL